MIATTPMTRSSDQPMSNMGASFAGSVALPSLLASRQRKGKELACLRRPRRPGAGRGLRLGGRSRLVLDHFRRRLEVWGGRGFAVALGHLLLEALDALGEVAHQARNLACAEQEHEHENDEKPVPDAAETHENLPAPSEPVLQRTMAAKRGRSQAAGVARAGAPISRH